MFDSWIPALRAFIFIVKYIFFSSQKHLNERAIDQVFSWGPKIFDYC